MLLFVAASADEPPLRTRSHNDLTKIFDRATFEISKNENSTLKNEIEELKAQLAAQTQQAEANHALLQQQFDALKESNKKAEADLQNIMQQLVESKKESIEHATALQGERGKNLDLTTSLEITQTQLTALTNSYTEEKSAHDITKAEVTKLQNEYEQLKQQFDDLKTQKEEKDLKYKNYETEFAELKAYADTQYGECEKYKAYCRVERKKNDEAIAAKATELAALKKKQEVMQADFEKAKNEAEISHQAEIATLNEKICALDTEKARLQTRVDEVNDRIEAARDEERKKLDKERKKINQEKTTLQQQLAELKRKADNALKELEITKAQLSKAKTQEECAEVARQTTNEIKQMMAENQVTTYEKDVICVPVEKEKPIDWSNYDNENLIDMARGLFDQVKTLQGEIDVLKEKNAILDRELQCNSEVFTQMGAMVREAVLQKIKKDFPHASKDLQRNKALALELANRTAQALDPLTALSTMAELKKNLETSEKKYQKCLEANKLFTERYKELNEQNTHLKDAMECAKKSIIMALEKLFNTTIAEPDYGFFTDDQTFCEISYNKKDKKCNYILIGSEGIKISALASAESWEVAYVCHPRACPEDPAK